MNIKKMLMAFMLLLALALSGCAGYAAYGYHDYPYYYDYGYYPYYYPFGYYPYGFYHFHHDFDNSHHFRDGHHGGHRWHERD